MTNQNLTQGTESVLDLLVEEEPTTMVLLNEHSIKFTADDIITTINQ